MISVIIPTYGRGAIAVDCIDSVLANDYGGFEIIVIDQGPGDALERSVRERYSECAAVRYLRMEPPGLNRARNLGLQHAAGEIVAFIDDDAVADRQWLSAIAAAFDNVRPRPGMVGGRLLPVWPGCRPRWLPSEAEVLLGLYDIGREGKTFPGGDLPIGANMAGSKESILAVGGFHAGLEADSERPGLQLTGGDSLLAQQIKDAGYSLYYDPRAVVYHRISANKLRVGAFVRRHYWEGVTEVTRMTLAGAITTMNAGAVRAHHRRQLAGLLLRSVAPSTWLAGTTWPLTAMRILTRAAHVIGVLAAIRSVGQPSVARS